MALPTPEPGLVVNYGFVWAGDGRPTPPDTGKDRPCLIVDVLDSAGPPGRTERQVTYLPISHTSPRTDERAHLIPPRVAEHLGLTAERSYLYTSYACEDDWPMDLSKIPGTDRFDYGFVPPAFFAAVVRDFAEELRRRPGLPHPRS
ncbi:MAG: growth inhibitor PemK [Devosia nanyangense]|uniref:Growth inhibitor PemK n=1 Tax=Devosia nanyangense TaxID=1228055 RepID=A0A933NWF0_9HYPH|nr:growth inhibitor PemK [Devosia nanyangense]